MNVAIVGLGYVGLPLAMDFADAGIDVVGIDVDAAKVASLAAGKLAHRERAGHAPRCRAARSPPASTTSPSPTRS